MKQLKIGVIIGRYDDIDGVSLETKKWIKVLRRMGHTVDIISGGYPNYHSISNKHYTTLPSLSFFSPECEWEQKRAFFYPDTNPGDLLNHLERTTQRLAKEIFKWIVAKKFDTLLVQNASALPCHLSMGMAVKNIIDYGCLNIVTHDHDFSWERGDRYKSPHKEITEIISETFPPKNTKVKHAVINHYSQDYLKNKFDIESTVIPNVMDFSTPYAQLDDTNRKLLGTLGISKDEIPLFQITRIERRKGIEVAIDLIDRLQDNKVKLVITGSKADDVRFGYYHELVEMIEDRGLQKNVIFGGHSIEFKRSVKKHGHQVFSLSDAYANARATTYFSHYEGFGNAFVESVLAKRPIFVNNYQPVYWQELGNKGFETVMLNDADLTDKAVQDIDTIIHNKKRCKEIAEHNFKLGKKYFSFEVLEKHLTKLFTF